MDQPSPHPKTTHYTQMLGYEYIYFPLWKGARGFVKFSKEYKIKKIIKKNKKVKIQWPGFFF